MTSKQFASSSSSWLAIRLAFVSLLALNCLQVASERLINDINFSDQSSMESQQSGGSSSGNSGNNDNVDRFGGMGQREMGPVQQESPIENWKKWSPPAYQASAGSLGSINRQSSHSSYFDKPYISSKGYHHMGSSASGETPLTNCSHFSSSCHECTRHRRECSFLLCESRSLCINVNDPNSIQQAHTSLHEIIALCHFVDQCSAYGKRNIQQLSSHSSYYARHGLENPGPSATLAKLRSKQQQQLQQQLQQQQGDSNNKQRHSQDSSSSSSSSDSDGSSSYDSVGSDYYHPQPYLFSASKSGNSGQVRRSLASLRYQNSMSARRKSAERDAAKTAEADTNTKGHRSAYHIGVGTIIALVVCSSLVLSAVITVAYKKIMKIYNNNRNLAYGTLEEDQ